MSPITLAALGVVLVSLGSSIAAIAATVAPVAPWSVAFVLGLAMSFLGGWLCGSAALK